MWSRRRVLTHTMAAGGLVAAGPACAEWVSPRPEPRRARTLRAVQSVVPGMREQVGDVLKVNRTLPHRGFATMDPFLLLDHMRFDLVAGETGRLAPHPHRGFETVTLMFDGGMKHRDSLGNESAIGPGGMQWMTAGRGIVHDENPPEPYRATGGPFNGVQLWVNLPARLKMTPAAYRPVQGEHVPSRSLDGVTVRVYAGRVHGLDAGFTTLHPVLLAHYRMEAGAALTVPLARDHNAFVQVLKGGPVRASGGEGATRSQLLAFERNGDAIQLYAEQPTELLLGAGQPIGEPVVSHGPFVMNTKQQILQAVRDYRAGRMGVLEG